MKYIKTHLFLISSIVVLSLTTVYWSLLSAIIQQQNADQLADPALFEHWSTFSHSVFPTQHTFLLKWPLFFVVQLFHGSPAAFIAATVVLCLVTVGLFAWILSRIEKRPHMIALLFLALSTVLLLVPIEPKPGSLLPVGMGMLATRNIEYVVFLGALLLLFQQKRWRAITPSVIAAVSLLALLFVSDQLFTGLLFGGGGLFFLSAVVFKKKDMRQKVTAILLAGAAALVISALIVLIMRWLGILDSPGGVAGPYGGISSPKEFALGIVYGVMGVLSQFGANPVSGTVIAPELPGALIESMRSPIIIGYLINAIVGGAIIISAVVLVKKTLLGQTAVPRKMTKTYLTRQSLVYFGLFGIATALASCGLFIVTNHYFAVDARYMGIVFFAGFIVLALQLSTMKLKKTFVVAASMGMAIGCILGMYGIAQSFQASRTAYTEVNRQNERIAQALQHHSVKTFIADYWRAYPVINKASTDTRPLPLDGCFTPRKVLTSRLWEQDVYNKSFAYLLTTEKTGTGYPACELSKVWEEFGSPSDSVVIEGTANNPKTMVLFYDNGKNEKNLDTSIRPNDTSLVRTLSDLNDGFCAGRRVVLQTVAHEDDDLIFMNPDLIEGVRKGDCVRTIYLTAGDAGSSELYWLGREEGAKAAYTQLFGDKKLTWISRDVQLSGHHQVKILQLRSNYTYASLVFMRLPDGNVSGDGFTERASESLSKLNSGVLPSIGSVDATSRYTKADIITALGQLMNHYNPSIVRTQAVNNHSERFRDHDDHLAVGRLTQEAFTIFNSTHADSSIQYYIGYPVRARQGNIMNDSLAEKKSIFYTYAQHDPSTCTTDAACENTAYRFYLNRQYTE